MEERKHEIRIELEPRYCDHCKKRFLPAREKQRFCTHDCHKVWWKIELRRQRLEKKKAARESNQPAAASTD